MHYKQMKLKFVILFSTFVELILAATLEKTYALQCQNGVILLLKGLFCL